MPRPQVYGKRSRAVYDPLAVFASPQRTLQPVQVCSDSGVPELVDQVQQLKLYQEARDGRSGGARVVLGERSPNRVVAPPVLVVEGKKPRKRRAKRIVEEDEEPRPTAELEVTGDQPVADSEPGLKEAHGAVEPAARTPEPQSERQSADHEVACITAQTERSSFRSDVPQIEEPALGEQTVAEAQAASLEVRPPRQQEEPVNVHITHSASLLALSHHPLTPFAAWSAQLSTHFTLTKIAEASFGEVYRLSLLEQLPGLSRTDESVFKVIALKSPSATLPKDKKKRKAMLKRAEAMSKPEDVANEVRLLQRMSSIPGFTNFRDVRILQGRPGALFNDAFRAYNVTQKANEKDPSIFPDPAKKGSYSDEQLWAVIEMQDAGTDLERLVEMGHCMSVWSVWDVFWQVVLTLAKGEEGAEFEHRDLHLGNICVRPSPSLPPSAQNHETIDVRKKLNFTSFETTVIDYTISRALMPDNSVAFHDLSLDNSLFEGDSTEEYQYDIYRYMRGAVLLSDALADFSLASTTQSAANSKRGWRGYHPVTNLVWLHFVLYRLLEQLDWPSAAKAPPKKRKQEHAVWKRANDLEHKLLKIQSLLDPEILCTGPLRSASDIVGLALTEGWLDEADVVGAAADDGSEDGEQAAESELVEELTHLQIRVDVMEERGLEAAEREAKAAAGRHKKRK
ncbi:hypothetical protein LTR85_011031 [Meristemomyces frigidus]|nr:hypothetical protein LTR85_011031 [Meristemomyces frigidus]